MKLHALILLLLTSFALSVALSSVHHGEEGVQNSDLSAPVTITRRILHQPLFSSSSSPPPDTDSGDSSVSPPPPPPDSSGGYNPDQPFFPEVPNGEGGQNQTPTSPPPPSSTGSEPIPSATQSTKPTKKVAIVVSTGIVTLGMLCALLFYVYRHKLKHPVEEQKLEGGNSNSRGYADESRAPPSSFLYLGTVEHSGQISVPTTEDIITPDGSPYRKFNPVKKSDRYRPSPDLQPLPPLSRSPAAAPVTRTSPSRNSITATALSSSEDEGSHDMAFYTPHGSTASFDEGYSTPNSRQSFRSNGSSRNSFRGEIHGSGSMPYSKRTSSRSRLPASSHDVIKHAIIPSIKTAPQPTPPPPPPLPQEAPFLQPLSPGNKIRHMPGTKSSMPRRAKFGTPPPPPNLALLQSISSQPDHTPEVSNTTTVPPPPPPPPPPQPISTAPKVRSTWTNYLPRTSEPKSESQYPTSPTLKDSSWKENAEPAKNLDGEGTSSGRPNGDDMDGTMPKLRPLHWDKVRATSDRATVWDQMRPSSFQLNEDAMESLFGCSSNNSNNTVNKETNRKPVPHIEKEYRVLDPKKSQNIAILLRALNVTRDEVSEALLDGNPEALGAELLETLVKMAPTKEEEIKLKEYKGDNSKLGSAEKFLKAILDIPLAFTRVEAMLYRANFDAEVKYLRKSFETLEEASHELRNSKLFLKLLEAVLTTGNRMNVGTNRGGAKSFKLDTLLKLVDVKGTDGKTTLLHFVVQEIIRSEGTGSATMTGELGNQTSSKGKEEEFRRQGLQVVSGLSREIGNVKLAAGMDSDVLHNYVSKLETGLQKVRAVLQYESLDMQGRFFESMKTFVSKAEVEICRIQVDERKALTLVREVTQYFHGDATKEEAHPLRIFMVVRDFLSTLDHVCKDVGTMQDRPVMGAARSFRISSNAPLPVLSRYNARQNDTSSEDSSSP